ncbi:hypothetical protein PIB30_095562 [Stylosanthes scabra]|uniref:Uncharacterized protein n=1 Tax=Stylosanthes scabra TaxID=79078 RepID=A0ABU6QWC9_9FABA|nr:hypothetical protein [Stylosanthes scabra]
MHIKPVLVTYLNKIKECAANTYTLNLFQEVRHEIEKVGALNVFVVSEADNKVRSQNVDKSISMMEKANEKIVKGTPRPVVVERRHDVHDMTKKEVSLVDVR